MLQLRLSFSQLLDLLRLPSANGLGFVDLMKFRPWSLTLLYSNDSSTMSSFIECT